MKDDNFTMLASALLGALQMSIFFGFDIMAFTVESVMHSVQSRCPDCIIDFAGYYGFVKFQNNKFRKYLNNLTLIAPSGVHYS